MNSTPRTVLVLHPAGLADTVLALPALHALRRHFPEAHITVACGARSADYLKLAAVADETLAVGRFGRELLSPGIFFRSASAWRKLGERRDDLVITLRKSTENRLILKLLPSASQRSLADEAGKTLTGGLANLIDRIAGTLGAPAPPLHVAQMYLKALEPLGVRPTIPEPKLTTDREADVRMDKLLEKQGRKSGDLLVGLHPGAGVRDPHWPVERFASIGSRLVHNFRAKVVVFGGPGERSLARRIVKQLPKGGGFATVSPAPADFASLLARLSVLVAHLSGPAHLAAALGVPVAAISGQPQATNKDLLGRGLLHIRGARIDLISEEEVYDAACRLLTTSRAGTLGWRE